jgi:hypothetical protein
MEEIKRIAKEKWRRSVVILFPVVSVKFETKGFKDKT